MNAIAAAIGISLRARARAAGRRVHAIRAEALTAFSLLAGWLLLTDALAQVHAFSPAIVWRVSFGLLGISLAGWKFVGQMAWQGLYELTRDDA